MEDLKNNLNREHFMKIEYSDGTIHNVDCYKFTKAILENGEEVFFIEYKDYDNKRDGEYTDSYSIVVNVNGKWKKSDRKIDYSHLSQKTIHQYDPKLLGNYLDFYHLSNSFTPNQLNSSTIKKRIQPQTQTQSEREKQPPIVNDEEDDKNEYFITKEEAYVAQTQTQTENVEEPPVRDNIQQNSFYVSSAEEDILQTQTDSQRQTKPPIHKRDNAPSREIIIPIYTDRNKKFAYPLFLESRGLLYNGIINKSLSPEEKNVGFSSYYDSEGLAADVTTWGSFSIIELPKEVIHQINTQFNELNRVSHKNFKYDTIIYSDLKEFTFEDTVYRFVPSAREINLAWPRTKIEVLLNDDSKKMSSSKIVENFCDYSLPIGRTYYEIPVDDKENKKVFGDDWVGYTMDVEIGYLRQENEYLKRLIVNNEMNFEKDNPENNGLKK